MKLKFSKPAVILVLILSLILLAFIVKNRVYSGYKNQWLLTKEVTRFSFSDSGMTGSFEFEIQVEDDIITAIYSNESYSNGGSKEIIKNEWTKEKFTSYLAELTRYGVIYWKEEYGTGNVQVDDGDYWNLYIKFSDGTDFNSHGYFTKPDTYDEFIETTLTYFSKKD